MHPYFLQHGNPNFQWLPPPDIADASWRFAFETGNAQVKHNIANEWLWLLNKEMSKIDGRRVLYFIAPHAALYAKISPYVDSVLFMNHRLKGVLTDFTDTSNAQWESVNNSSLFIEQLDNCWFLDGENPARFHDILKFCDNQSVHGLEVVKHYLYILEALIENNMSNTKKDEALWYELSVLLAARSGLLALDPDGTVHDTEEQSPSYAWKKLCYMVRYGKKLTKEQKRNDTLTPVINSTEPLVAVKAFDLILGSHALAKRTGPPVLPAKTILNDDGDDTSNVYPMLRTWIPALSDMWSAAESLDMPYQTVFSNIIKAAPQKAAVHLPDDIRI